MFKHDPLPKLELIRQDLPTGRVYITPEGHAYPSMTSVLGFEPNPHLDVWRARVGEAEANAVGARAANRGTIMHQYSEDYLSNKDPNVSMFDLSLWKRFRPVLNDLDNIRLLEGKLYSDRLQLAGTTDIIGDYKGILSICDVKTALRMKKEEDILNYFIQATGYACMAYERYGIMAKQIVILIAVDDHDPQVFVKKIGPYLEPLYDIIRRYKEFKANSCIH